MRESQGEVYGLDATTRDRARDRERERERETDRETDRQRQSARYRSKRSTEGVRAAR